MTRTTEDPDEPDDDCGISAEFDQCIELLDLVGRNFVAAAVKGRRMQTTARKLNYSVSAAAYKLAICLRADPELRQKFENEPLWEHRAKLNPERLLSYAFMYFYGNCHGQVGERARDHARALQPSFDDRVSPLDVYRLLVKHGGFARLKTSYAERKNTIASRSARVHNNQQTIRAQPEEQDAENARPASRNSSTAGGRSREEILRPRLMQITLSVDQKSLDALQALNSGELLPCRVRRPKDERRLRIFIER